MRDWSQFGEQAYIVDFFRTIGLTHGHILDLGASYAKNGSNSKGLMEALSFTADLYDADPDGATDVIQTWIDIDFKPKESHYDMISIDLDGNDYHILKAVLSQGLAPSLIVAEINPIFRREVCAVMPYKADHCWDGTTYYGMSLGACEKLGRAFGYTLVNLNAGINAFLARDDLAATYPQLVRPIDYRIKYDHAIKKGAWENV